MAVKIKTVSEYRPVYIVWLDSSGSSYQGWHSIESHNHDVAKIETVGFVISETEEILSLAMNVSENDNMMGDISIPKFAIVKRVDL